jgi:hypothetical protein
MRIRTIVLARLALSTTVQLKRLPVPCLRSLSVVHRLWRAQRLIELRLLDLEQCMATVTDWRLLPAQFVLQPRASASRSRRGLLPLPAGQGRSV